MAAAVCYTASGIFMRQVSVLKCDPSWAVWIRESVTVVAVAPFLIYRILWGLPVLPPAKILFILILAGLADQLVGNLGWQWSVGIVGLAVTVPAAFGVMIAGSAVFGRIVLGEKVTPRSMGAIGLLVVSLVLLGMGAQWAGKQSADPPQAAIAADDLPEPDALLVVQAVFVAGAAGAAYAMLSIAIRHTMKAKTQQTTLMFIITGMGLLALGPVSLQRQGLDGLLATPWEQIAWIVAGGVFNLLGFMAITKGLHLITVVHANVLNASQVAMSALAGIMIFNESPNFWLLLGVVLTLLGIFLVDQPIAEEIVDQTI
jgi:DME family drug/metabolite transporter